MGNTSIGGSSSASSSTESQGPSNVLIHAAHDKNVKMVREVLEIPEVRATINNRYFGFRGISTLLHFAAEEGHMGLLSELLVAGADPRTTDSGGRTPLHIASTAEVVAQLLAIPDVEAAINDRDSSGRTPLHHAADNNYIDALNQLLAAGADPQITDSQGLTPLHLAQDGRIVKRLLKAGLDKDIVSQDGSTPFHFAAPAAFWSWSAMSELVKAGANPNAADNTGATTLHKLALETDERSCQTLKCVLDEVPGIIVNAVNKDGATPLHIAAAYGNEAVIELLLGAGADKTMTNIEGKTPFDLATEGRRRPSIVRLLKTDPYAAPRMS